MTIVIAILVFGILVLVHEFGHYIIAVKNGILVEEFAIGMGPKLISVQKGETKYSIRLLPIGGFCKMLGEDDNSNDNRAVNNKGVWARFAVISAGAIMNFLLAAVIVLIINLFFGFATPVISSVLEGYPASQAGMMKGDRIVKLNNSSVHIYQDIPFFMMDNGNKTVKVTVKRDNQLIDMNITPQLNEEGTSYLLGFTRGVGTGIFQKQVEGFERASISETFTNTFWTVCFYVKSTVVGFTRLLTFQVSTDEIAGPIGIVNFIGESYETGMKTGIIDAIVNVASLAALLSANLGAINLLPLPALDGGRLVFIIIEAIRRKPIDPEKEGMVHFAGFVLLMILMVFIAYNDIAKLL